MFKKFLAFLRRLVVSIFVAPEDRVKPEILLESKIMTQIDAKRLDDLEKLIAVLAIQLQRLAEEERKTQEYMVHLSTLHEELLNQLDQGNIAMVRVRRDEPHPDDELDAMMNESAEFAPKKKSELN